MYSNQTQGGLKLQLLAIKAISGDGGRETQLSIRIPNLACLAIQFEQLLSNLRMVVQWICCLEPSRADVFEIMVAFHH